MMMMMILMMAAINRCFMCVILVTNLDTVMFQHGENWVTVIRFVALYQTKCCIRCLKYTVLRSWYMTMLRLSLVGIILYVSAYRAD
jgi:hypothetical protein